MRRAPTTYQLNRELNRELAPGGQLAAARSRRPVVHTHHCFVCPRVFKCNKPICSHIDKLLCSDCQKSVDRQRIATKRNGRV
jgi:hypothetical protein